MGSGSVDAAIVKDLAAGEISAPARLIQRKRPQILALCTRLLGDPAEAEDVAQEVLAQACRQAVVQRPGPEKFEIIVNALALRLCRKRRAGRREEPRAEVPEREDPAPPADEALIAAERSLRVRKSLEALPARQREALVLRHYEGLSNIAAALAMEISVDAFESLLARGRRRLKERLKGL